MASVERVSRSVRCGSVGLRQVWQLWQLQHWSYRSLHSSVFTLHSSLFTGIVSHWLWYGCYGYGIASGISSNLTCESLVRNCEQSYENCERSLLWRYKRVHSQFDTSLRTRRNYLAVDVAMCSLCGTASRCVALAPHSQSVLSSAAEHRSGRPLGGAVAASHETQSMFTPSVNFRVILSLLWYNKKYNSTKVCILSINSVHLVSVAFSCLQSSFPFHHFISSFSAFSVSKLISFVTLCALSVPKHSHSPPHPSLFLWQRSVVDT